MEISALWGALRRRWYLTLLATMITLGATYAVVDEVGPSYMAEGTVLLFPPSNSMISGGEVVTDGNPYLYLGGLNPARDILVRSLTSKSARTEIAETFPTAEYEMTSDITTSGPIILITVEAATEGESLATLTALIDQAAPTLHSLQKGLGIPQSAFITSKGLTQDPAPEVVRKDQIRAGIVAAGGLATMMLFGIGLVDGMLNARVGRRVGGHTTAAPGASGDAGRSGRGRWHGRRNRRPDDPDRPAGTEEPTESDGVSNHRTEGPSTWPPRAARQRRAPDEDDDELSSA